MAAGAATVAREVLQSFGVPVVDVKPLMSKKALPVLFDHSHADVREAGKALAVELFRWVGPAVKPCLKGLKPVQLKELDALWDEVTPGSSAPTRFPRSAAQTAGPATDDGESGEAAGPSAAAPPATMDA